MTDTSVTVLGKLPTGARLIATGHFVNARDTTFLVALANGSYGFFNIAFQSTPVSVPSGYSIIGAGPFDATKIGLSQLLLRKSSGEIASASYDSATNSLQPQMIGNPGTAWSVVGEGLFGSWHNGSHQVVLDSTQNGNHIVWLYGKQPQLTLPTGFKAIGAGNFFGSDLSGVLIQKADGTLSVVFDAQETHGSFPVDTVIAKLGTLQSGDTVVAVANDTRAGTANILIQNGQSLSELVVREGIIQRTVSLGTLPVGATIAGFIDINGDGAPDVLLTTNTGAVETVLGSPTAKPTASLAAVGAARAAIVLAAAYGQTTNVGVNSTLSNTLAQLASGRLAAAGTTILKMETGTISQCSFEQVAAGNITFAAWQQNVVTLNAIAELCREQGISVQMEASLDFPGFFLAGTEQWLQPALAAGLPILYVEDNAEPDPRTLDWKAATQNALQNIALISAAFPGTKFGQWVVMNSSNPADDYHTALRGWWTTFNQAAAAAGLPGLSYAIADQFYGPVYDPVSGLANAIGQAPGDTPYSMFQAMLSTARASGVSVEMNPTAGGAYLSTIQLLARAERQVAVETSPNVAAIELDYAVNWLPVSGAVNAPGSGLNLSAELAATEPLYRAGRITTQGPVALSVPNQTVQRPGIATALAGLSITAADAVGNIAVVLIAQSAALSVSTSTGLLVSNPSPNILILSGTPALVNAALASLKLLEPAQGPDAVDVEVFGRTGRVAGAVINILASDSPNGGSFLPTQGQNWLSSSATVTNGKIVSETLVWNQTNGLSSSKFIGGSTIAPVVEIAVHQPLLQGGLTVVNGKAAMPASYLQYNSGGWKIYDPLEAGGWSSEVIDATLASSKLTFDPISGALQRQEDTIAPATYSGRYPYTDATHPFYFSNGGMAVTTWAVPNNPYWTTSLYANGAGGVLPIVNGSSLILAAGNTTLMAVGSVQTIFGSVNGVQRVVEVKYHGGASNPYDEIDQVFNPFSATPVLWQQIQTVAIPQSLADNTPLPVPNAVTTIEYNTGDNPNWSDTIWLSPSNSLSVAGYKQVATTMEEGILEGQVAVSGAGVVTAARGVNWIDEGTVLDAYVLPPPTITGYYVSNKSLLLTGTGIAGDQVVVVRTDGGKIGGAQVSASGAWQLAIPTAPTGATSYQVTAQQFNLAANSSMATTPFAVYSTSNALSPSALPRLWFQHQSGQLAQWSVNNLGIASSANITPVSDRNQSAVAIGNFYRDGSPDVLWQRTDGTVSVWQMQGENLLGRGVVGNPGTSWHVTGLGDFYKDGNTTVLWQNDNGSVALWDMQGASIVQGQIIAANPGPTWHVKGVGDFYRDGNADILWQNDNGSAALWEMNGAAIVRGEVIAANPGPTWRIVGAGDFYGNGAADILWQNDNGSVALWDMQGASIVQGQIIAANPGPTWHIKAVTDVNNDHKSDITWENDNGSIAIWQMNGADIISGSVLANPGNSWTLLGSPTAMRFIYSTAANEVLTANPVTPDEFVLTQLAPGMHTISGFNPTQDIIELDSAMFRTVGPVLSATEAVVGGSLIHVGSSASVFLQGVDKASLHDSNFALS